MMNKLVVVVISSLLLGGSLSAQSSTDLAIAVARDRYVRIETHTLEIRNDGRQSPVTTANGVATGFRISNDLVLTNFHVLGAGSLTMSDWAAAEYVKVAPELDLVLLRIHVEKKMGWIKLADAKVGETVYAFTNADEQDGFLTAHFVSKMNPKYIYLQEPIIPGASGSGLVNKQGELVGISMQNQTVNNGEGMHAIYGQAIPASTLRVFLKDILPNQP